MKFGNYLVALVIAAVAPIALAAEPLFVDGDTVREVQQTLRDRGFRLAWTASWAAHAGGAAALPEVREPRGDRAA